MPSESMSEHHLARAQHTPPPTVSGEAGVLQGRELPPVCTPHQAIEVPFEPLYSMSFTL